MLLSENMIILKLLILEVTVEIHMYGDVNDV